MAGSLDPALPCAASPSVMLPREAVTPHVSRAKRRKLRDRRVAIRKALIHSKQLQKVLPSIDIRSENVQSHCAAPVGEPLSGVDNDLFQRLAWLEFLLQDMHWFLIGQYGCEQVGNGDFVLQERQVQRGSSTLRRDAPEFFVGKPHETPSEHVHLVGRFEVLPSVGTWLTPLCNAQSSKRVHDDDDMLMSSAKPPVETCIKDQTWHDEADARWWYRGQIICYFCGDPECQNLGSHCCERRRREILLIDDPSDSESDTEKSAKLVNEGDLSNGENIAMDGMALTGESSVHSNANDTTDPHAIRDAFSLERKQVLLSRVDFMVKFVEQKCGSGTPLQERMVLSILSKIKEIQAWNRSFRKTSEIEAGRCLHDRGGQTLQVSHFFLQSP